MPNIYSQLQGKNALIVGAGTGIGRGIAHAMAASGATVSLGDVREDLVTKVEKEIIEMGGQAIAGIVDIGVAASVNGLVNDTLSRLDRIDVVVNTAILRHRSLVVDMTDEQWHQTIAIGLSGSFYLARAVAPSMIERRSGTMIFFASDRGLYGEHRGANYAAAKGGVIALTKTLALELGQYNVTVNAVNPGTTPTPREYPNEKERELHEQGRAHRAAQDPLGRLSTVEDVCETVLFLAAIGGGYMTGQLVTTRMRFG